MMSFFKSAAVKAPYFEGWYFKHQKGEGETLALIPAIHVDGRGRGSASLQVITDDRAWWLEYPWDDAEISHDPFRVRLGRSLFDSRGISLDIEKDGLSLHGRLSYGEFTSLEIDIMGPFRLFSGMQCSHDVISMGHALEGRLELNGETLDFSGGKGYIETDRGRSFPNRYLWTQSMWDEPQKVSLMLAAATIPMPVGGFTGCICSVLCRGREYRLATYRGAKIEEWSPSGAVIRQGKYRLEAEVLSERRLPLRAPVEGSMERTVHESLCAEVCYSFWLGKELLFHHTARNAGFEYSAREKPDEKG